MGCKTDAGRYHNDETVILTYINLFLYITLEFRCLILTKITNMQAF